MSKRHGWALAALLGGLGLTLALNAPVHSQKAPEIKSGSPKQKAPDTLQGRVAQASKLSEDDVNKVLKALGPAVRDELKRGKTVTLPGLGTLRVVRIPQHKDMEIGTGRPLTVAAENTIEFLPTGELVGAANSDGAVPAETVPPFQYIPLPGQTPGQKVGQTRVPSTRVR